MRAPGRGVIAAGVLALWLVGVGLLVRDELFRPRSEWLGEVAMRVNPTAVFFGAERDGHRMGFASRVLDTASSEITIMEYLVADRDSAGESRRESLRTRTTLSRGLRLRGYEIVDETPGVVRRTFGAVSGDSVVTITSEVNGREEDTRRVSLPGPVIVPALVPLSVALGREPHVGKKYTFSMLDPGSGAVEEISFRLTAESLFVVHDSAVFDPASGRWRGALPATIRAWQVSSAERPTNFSGWVDAQGEVVLTVQRGYSLRRLPYEEAFENWRIESGGRGPEPMTPAGIPGGRGR